jgi:galactose-1-phosphate uridylyltransferase
MPIHFESVTREAHLLNPIKNFEPESQLIEHRYDPLTGRSVIVLKGRLDYVRGYMESDENAVAELANSTEQNCPFCRGFVEKKAPKFIPEICAEGRIRVGEAVCFPSLFAHMDNNAVVVPTPSHSLSLNQIRPEMFRGAFKACIEYFRRLRVWRPEVKNNAIVMNFYPPAGSTIAHPHIQALASDLPFRATNELVKASALYHQREGTSYWSDLTREEEKMGVRYLGKLGRTVWITPFAPRGLSEVQGIVPNASDLSRLSDSDLNDLSGGITRALAYYNDIRVRSFNFAIYSGPFDDALDYYDLNVRIVSRYGYKSRFVSDVWALQYLLGEQEVCEAPEETCVKLKKYFQ